MNPNDTSSNPSPPPRPGWNRARPEKLPELTYWPAMAALAVTFCLWGFASSFILTAVGLGLFAVALAGWIGDIRHERKTQ